MTKLQQSIMLVKHIATGLMIPILSVLLLQKGATMQTLPLLFATFSVTVACMEVPSGIFADMYGRKKVFIMSCVLQIIAVSLLFFAGNPGSMALAMVFFGSGRAFSSGSLDALFIDQAMDRQGENILVKVTAQLAILEGVGFAAGSIAGGFIASVTNTYLSNLIVQFLLNITLVLICLLFVQEQPAAHAEQQRSLKDHLKEGKQLMLSSRKFTLIFISVFVAGFAMSTVETYWQPTFANLSKMNNVAWALGLITFAGFITAILGSTLGQMLMDKFKGKWWIIYNICRTSLGVTFIIYALQESISGFVTGYGVIYVFIGINGVVETTIINKWTPGRMRASVLSLSSLITQIGVLVASVLSSLLVVYLEVSGIWAISGILVGGYALILIFAAKDR
jgi:MFS family permease